MQSSSRLQIEMRSASQKITIRPNLKYNRFKIESVTVPHIWNYLPAEEVVFTDSLGVVTHIPFPSEQPSINDLALLASALTSADTGGAIYTFNLDTLHMVFSISSTANFGLTFQKYTAQHAGITNVVSPGRFGISNSNILQSGHFYFGSQVLLLKTGVEAIGEGTTYDNYSPPMSPSILDLTQSSYLINLPIKSAIGELETFYIGDLAPKYHMAQNPMTLSINLTDEFGVPIDVSPQRWYLTIIYYCE